MSQASTSAISTARMSCRFDSNLEFRKVLLMLSDVFRTRYEVRPVTDVSGIGRTKYESLSNLNMDWPEKMYYSLLLAVLNLRYQLYHKSQHLTGVPVVVYRTSARTGQKEVSRKWVFTAYPYITSD